MDAKNWEAVGQGGAWMLWKFASLPFEKAATERFLQQYGDLSPGLTVRECQIYVKIFRSAWKAKTWDEKESVSQHITGIFERDNSPLRLPRSPAAAKRDREKFDASWGGLPPYDSPQMRPAVTADFTTGAVTIKPRTLLDWLAKSLLDYRDKLAVCERKDCPTPYYVKAHARQRYCSPDCAYAVRTEEKRRWWKDNRGSNKPKKESRPKRKR